MHLFIELKKWPNESKSEGNLALIVPKRKTGLHNVVQASRKTQRRNPSTPGEAQDISILTSVYTSTFPSCGNWEFTRAPAGGTANCESIRGLTGTSDDSKLTEGRLTAVPIGNLQWNETFYQRNRDSPVDRIWRAGKASIGRAEI
jgi:hypothetical protein